MSLVGGGGAARNIDHFRHAIERIDPVAYLTHGYYGRWLGGLETIVVEAGVLDTRDDHAARDGTGRVRRRSGLRRDRRRIRIVSTIDPRSPAIGDRSPAPPRFAVGDRVRTRAHGVPGHTRLPAYARGRRGTIVALHGGWVFPDTNAHGRGENPQHLYTVAFDGAELWGATANPESSCISTCSSRTWSASDD